MLDSTDRMRFMPQMQMPMQRPQLDMGMGQFMQPTQVAPAMEPPAMQPTRSVLKGRMEQEQRSEENIRRLLEQMRGGGTPFMR